MQEPENNKTGSYTYICKDIDCAMAKLNEIEQIMDYWISTNEGYEYRTSLMLGEQNVVIELTIFQ